MRGYRALKHSDRLNRIAAVKQALTGHHLNLTEQVFSPHLMGLEANSGEIILRQYLLIRVGGINLNRALLMAMGKKQGRVVFYLPTEWRDVLHQHGFKVARFRSAVLWQLFVFAMLMCGLLQIGKTIFAAIITPKKNTPRIKRSIYFADLGPGNLPQVALNGQSHDVISWYLQWPGRIQGIEVVQHNVANTPPVSAGDISIVPCPGPLPTLTGVRAVCGYVLWGMRAIAIAFMDWMRGRWWHAFILNQAALAAQVRFLSPGQLAREYLFNNSGWIYRPLWTYEADRRGSRISFYFYSTNCEFFMQPKGYPQIPYGWKAMTWPGYLVWDNHQADFVRRAVKNPGHIAVVGSIWFQSCAARIPQHQHPCIAVFDVTPHRYSRYCTLGMPNEYYIPATSKMFLEHIDHILRHLPAVMLLKCKRKIGTLAHPHYRHLIDRLVTNDNVILVDPDISAWEVIKSSCAVISMPFTSTALIGKELGKPSIYYDPTGQVQPNDRAAHGIPIVSGTDELQTWLIAQTKVLSSQALVIS